MGVWDGLRQLPREIVPFWEPSHSQMLQYVGRSSPDGAAIIGFVGGVHWKKISGQQTYADVTADLHAWAAANNYTLWASEYAYPAVLFQDGTRIDLPKNYPIRWWVTVGAQYNELIRSTVKWRPSRSSTPCPYCDKKHRYGTVVCPTTNQLLICPTCEKRNVEVFPKYGSERWPGHVPQEFRSDGHGITFNTLPTSGPLDTFSCSACGSRCETCGEHAGRNRRFCDSHGSDGRCCVCSTRHQWSISDPSPFASFTAQATGRTVVACHACLDRLCVQCGVSNEVRNLVVMAEFGGSVCTGCRRNLQRQSHEAFDEGTSDALETMKTVPGREVIRLIGIEIEGGNGTYGGDHIAADFHRLGISSASRMTEYHAGSRYGVAHVEPDSSVDWEAVIGPLNMADAAHATLLDGAVKAMRDRVRKGHASLDLRCGLHVHVSAARVGLNSAWNLSHLFTYLEDPLFRISAAKWPYHRASMGSHYCAPIPKFERKMQFYNEHGGSREGRANHYFAISFSNYFQSMIAHCHCGAVSAGLWEECTCSDDALGKCTFEFRLFNTTVNPRKIIAYLALSQALTAKAISIQGIKSPEEEFPGLAFNRQMVKEMNPEDQAALAEAWKPRLRYIFNELPMTGEEKEAVLYCVKNCEIAQILSAQEIKEVTS